MHHEIPTYKLNELSTIYKTEYKNPIHIGDTVSVHMDNMVIHAIAVEHRLCDDCPFSNRDENVCMIRNKYVDGIFCATKQTPRNINDYVGFESLDKIMEEL